MILAEQHVFGWFMDDFQERAVHDVAANFKTYHFSCVKHYE